MALIRTRTALRASLLSSSALAIALTTSLGAVATAPLAAQDAAPATESKAGETPPVVLVRPSGVYLDLPEQGSDLTALLTGGGSEPKDFYEFLDVLAELENDEVEHVLFDLSAGFAFNQPQLAEIERVVSRVKKSGKKLWAYIEGAGNGGYQIASLCDQILVADLGGIEVSAPSMNVTFLKDAFDLLGVGTDVVRCGDFKGAVEPYVLPKMSTHLRDHYLAMLESINRDAVERISRGRKLSTAQVREAQQQMLFTARAAADAGLVDKIVPWIGAERALKLVTHDDSLQFENILEEEKKNETINPLTLLSKLLNPKEEEDVESQSIVVLHLQGGIVDGTSPSAGSIVSGPTVSTIRKLTRNDDVKGVVVRINSPGGSATASEAILLALRDLAETKPVVMSMGRVAASGGYYVTCIGRPILAETGTITGSIGVFGMRTNFGPLMRRIGVHEEIVALDEEAASMMAMSRSWDDGQKAKIQAMINQVYDVFVGHVARSRGMTSGEVLEIAGGRVWSGQQAVENGLVDKIGGVHDAVAMVAKEAGLEGDFEIIHTPKPKSFFESLAAGFNAKAVFDSSLIGLATKRLNLDRALRIVIDSVQNERASATVWAMLPETYEIR